MIKILLLEDDEALAMGMEFTLKEEGYHVVKAGLVKDCIHMIDNEQFDLALLDISLPDGSGYDVCKYIRAKSEMPIIFLTAFDDEVNVVLGLEIGGDDYVTKPFRVKELVSRIKAVLRRSQTKQVYKEILRSGNIELHTLTVMLKKNGEDIPLTAQEYKLLLIFMNNPKIVLSKDTIFEKLLETSTPFMDDNTLAVYIKRLREKVEDVPSRPQYIVTQRGLGYKWNMNVIKE
ncbi:response regulator transcription factor [Bacillus aquiflavi]|uniref:Response regulator transcription factor n=1 Tax=Bacillus aquiflavi TaxID=2672567 RepID=A0A6B3VWU5_9BACI|nr:response regulator transcription factor [Bacillus aquiflavi]MBA4535615.1 response regulator transcription factor [Bacillus aquiflavi]NEY79991.1 response regulator transcription factor [Bacillus aquiflavi]